MLFYYEQSLGRNGKITLKINFNIIQQEELNQVLNRLNQSQIEKCVLVEPFENSKCTRNVLNVCEIKNIPVFIESTRPFPGWSIKHLMKSCDNEAIVVSDTMDKNKSGKEDPMKLLDSILQCFHNGVHSTLKFPSQLPNYITEYDLLDTISAYKNWIHLVSIDSSVESKQFDWKNIIDFIKENKIDLKDRKEDYKI